MRNVTLNYSAPVTAELSQAFSDSCNICLVHFSFCMSFAFLLLFLFSLPHLGAHSHLKCLSREGQAYWADSQYSARHKLQSCAGCYVLFPSHNHPWKGRQRGHGQSLTFCYKCIIDETVLENDTEQEQENRLYGYITLLLNTPTTVI